MEWDPDRELGKIAVDFFHLGRSQEPIDILKSLLPRQESFDGECSEYVITLLFDLALVYGEQSNFELARNYLHQTLVCRVKRVGYDDDAFLQD